jgi:hypothetical protein
MAKPPRQSGQRVTFTPASARRIAAVVQAYERGNGSIPAARQRTGGDDGGIVRGTFTGAWAKGSTKTVTDATLSAVTYEGVKNDAASLVPSGTMTVFISFVAGEWSLVGWDWHGLSGYSGSATQVLSHDASGLKWITTTDCDATP